MAASSAWSRYRSLLVSSFENIQPMESLQLATRLLSKAVRNNLQCTLVYLSFIFNVFSVCTTFYCTDNWVVSVKVADNKVALWVSNLKQCQIQACQSYSALHFREGVGTSLSACHQGLPGLGLCSSLREQKGNPGIKKKPGTHYRSNLTHLPKRRAGAQPCLILFLLMYSEQNHRQRFPSL